MGKSKMIERPVAPGREEALEAVRTLIRWAGDDPDRPGMRDTPERVLAFYDAFFSGYETGDVSLAGLPGEAAYEDFILIRDIKLASFCEHHMLPATGTAHIAYVPNGKIAGFGALGRIAARRASRFTTQEAITNGIIADMEASLSPRGAAVFVEMAHGCMGLRAPHQEGSRAVTVKFSGLFLDEMDIQRQFLMLTGQTMERIA